jgi:TRAP-type C4-dicarboxylate transport system permease small subunit
MLRLIRLFADGVAALMFAAVFLLFCLKIGMRYLAHDELAWTDEVAIILFIWIIFWANSFMLADRDHIRFDLVLHMVGPRARRLMAVGRALLIGGLFLYALPDTVDYILFLRRERTPVLGLKLDYVYMCFGVFIATVPLRAAWLLLQMGRRSWRDHV